VSTSLYLLVFLCGFGLGFLLGSVCPPLSRRLPFDWFDIFALVIIATSWAMVLWAILDRQP